MLSRGILAGAFFVCAPLAAASPFQFAASSTFDILSNLSGGLKTGTRVLNKTDATALFSGEEAGWNGIEAFVHGQWTHNNDFSGALVGDTHVVSNIDAPEGFRLMNAWVGVSSEISGMKLGVIDLNTEFDVQNVGALFLNSAYGVGLDFSQSGENGPSIFPATGLALVGWWQPSPDWTLKAGVFEGTPGDPTYPGRSRFNLTADEGVLLTFETRLQLTPGLNIGAGIWHYTADFDAIGVPARIGGNTGYYAIAEMTLLGMPEDEQRLDGWVRTGFANARINPVRFYIGGGLVYSAPFGRAGDAVGLAISNERFGGPARLVQGLAAAETAFEITYAARITDNLTLQPDIQYILRPGGDPSLRNAVVAGARVIIGIP